MGGWLYQNMYKNSHIQIKAAFNFNFEGKFRALHICVTILIFVIEVFHRIFLKSVCSVAAKHFPRAVERHVELNL